MHLLKSLPRICIFVTFFVLLVFFSACSSSTPEIPADATVDIQTPMEPEAAATETASPTATPQPKIYLVGLDGAETPDTLRGAFELFQQLAAQNGLVVEQSSDLTSVGQLDGVQVVVVSSTIPGIDSFASEHSSLQVLSIGKSDLQPGANLSLVNPEGDQADYKGFIAGYLASVITQDWRVGVITEAESVSGSVIGNSYSHGVVFFCGLCRPVYPPFYVYPIISEVPINASQEAHQAAADLLITSGVRTVYVQGSIAEDHLLTYLADEGMQFILDRMPLPEFQDAWVATLDIDLTQAIQTAWQRLMQGEHGFSVSAPLRIQASNDAILSPGRLQLVEKILDDLNQGYIDTGVGNETDGS